MPGGLPSRWGWGPQRGTRPGQAPRCRSRCPQDGVDPAQVTSSLGAAVSSLTSQSQDWVKGKGKRLEVWVGDETLTPRPSRFESQWGGQVLTAGNSDPERG